MNTTYISIISRCSVDLLYSSSLQCSSLTNLHWMSNLGTFVAEGVGNEVAIQTVSHIKLMIEIGMKNTHEHDALATYHISHTWSVPGRDVAIETCSSYTSEGWNLKVRVAGILVSAPNKCHTHINHVAWTKITITMLPRLTYHWIHTRCVPASQIQIATASTGKQTIKRCHLCHIPQVNGAENMIN